MRRAIDVRSYYPSHVSLPLICMLVLAPFLGVTPPVLAATSDGSLTITPIAAYNFIVDSNVLSPSTYAPEAGTLAAKVCNTSTTTTLTDVFVSIGNRTANTPGIYPTRTHPGLQGSYSLTHEGGSAGTADASRYLPSLGPGQCAMQYWLVSYPRTGPSDGTIVGAAGQTVAVTLNIKPADDLYLFYDMWASAKEGATTRSVDVTRQVTMRNEIAAAANVIWPNTTAKVPQYYLDAIANVLGWDTITPSGSTIAYPGQTVTTQGIWYDLGNVGFGFDNNNDGVPDQNVWLQPIGDPNSYDPGCFRLVRTYGIIVVKLKGGGEQLIPFVDQLYFENIPDNTNAVGLVYYQYAALDGACTAGLSPYQEVASGYDNEKFNCGADTTCGNGDDTTQSTSTDANGEYVFSSLAYDFGDLPASYSTTLSGAPDGARNSLQAGLYLGASAPDSETNGQPTAAAIGDGADEDGVTVPATRWNNGTDGGSFNVTVQGTGWLVAWIDFDRDGSFNDANEMVVNQAVSSGTANYPIDVPAGTFTGSGANIQLATRFRLFSSQPTFASIAYSSESTGGEVEDYLFSFAPTNTTVATFDVSVVGQKATLSWQTTSELHIQGFHILRSDVSMSSTPLRITPELILAEGDSISGMSYSWVDPIAPVATTIYWLEVVTTSEEKEIYGPVFVPRDLPPPPNHTLYLPVVLR